MKLYLVTLSGGGDIRNKLVTKETWDWIHSDHPDFSNSTVVDEKPPPVVQEGIRCDLHALAENFSIGDGSDHIVILRKLPAVHGDPQSLVFIVQKRRQGAE